MPQGCLPKCRCFHRRKSAAADKATTTKAPHRRGTVFASTRRPSAHRKCSSRAASEAMHFGKTDRLPQYGAHRENPTCAPKKQKEKRRRNSVFPLTLYVIAVDKSGFGSQPFPRAADPRPQDDPSGGIQLSNDGRQIKGWQSRQLGLTP